MNQKENLLDIVKLVWQKRKTIIYACLIAMVASALISLLLPNIYKSETVFYAANPSLGNPSSLVPNGKVIDQYGGNRDLDRLFAIANSAELFNKLNSKFDFFSHYNLDPNKAKAKTKLRKKFNKNHKLLKTEYDAFSLSFEDKDPKFAADVANKSREMIDFIAQSIIKSSQKSEISSFEKSIKKQELQLNSFLDSISFSKNKYKIFNVEAQEEAMAELVARTSFSLDNYTSKANYYNQNKSKFTRSRDSIRKYESLVETTQSENNLINEKLKLFNKGSNVIKILEREISSTISQLNLSKERYKKLRNSYSSPFKATHLVEKAYVSDAKYSPKRSIYVLATTFLTFIFTILVLLVQHNFKSLHWKEILKD